MGARHLILVNDAVNVVKVYYVVAVGDGDVDGGVGAGCYRASDESGVGVEFHLRQHHRHL